MLRIVNSHSVPARFAGSFTALVRQLTRSWALAAPADLPELLERGPNRPTLLFCFDDGLANTARTAAPILEAAGGRAVFAVPAAWPDVPPAERSAWFEEHVYPTATELHERPDDIAPATWHELRALIRDGHEVWSHGVDHVRLSSDLAPAVLEREIVESKRILEERLDTIVHGYCPPISHDIPPTALALIRRTYQVAFGGPPAPVPRSGDPHRIPRSNIEASWPTSAVTLQLSPLGDLTSRMRARVRG